MVVRSLPRWPCAVCILLVLSVVSPPAFTAELPQEIAAKTMLGEAEKLIECALPTEALEVLDKLETEHPGTEAAQWAEFRRAQCLMFLQQYDDAAEAARDIVARYPDTLMAAWAQTVVGEALVRKGATGEGVRELLKVSDMLPDLRDTGPVSTAFGVLGRVCCAQIKDKDDPLKAIDALGLSRDEIDTKAQLLAAIAACRMAQDRLDLANVVIDKLAAECPERNTELGWAVTEVARMAADRKDKHGVTAVSILSNICSSSGQGDDEVAKAHLALARYCKSRGDVVQTVAVLESARDRCLGTESYDEIIYELGMSLYRQGQDEQALATLRWLTDNVPLSGYTPSALYCIGTNLASNREAAREALTILAEGTYDDTWRALGLYKLGVMIGMEDKDKAMDCYAQAIKLLQKRLDEGKGDMLPNWQDMLEGRMRLVETEMRRLQRKAEEVAG